MSINNDVRFRGNLTADPVARDILSNGETIKKASFRIAINNGKTRAGIQREPTYIDVECFRSRAETILKYLKKGDEVFVAGELLSDNWVSQDGSQRTRLYLNLNDFAFGRSKADRLAIQASRQQAAGMQPQPQPQSAPYQRPAQAAPVMPQQQYVPSQADYADSFGQNPVNSATPIFDADDALY